MNDDADIQVKRIIKTLICKLQLSSHFTKKSLHDVIDQVYNDRTFDSKQEFLANEKMLDFCAEFIVVPRPNCA